MLSIIISDIKSPLIGTGMYLDCGFTSQYLTCVIYNLCEARLFDVRNIRVSAYVTWNNMGVSNAPCTL